MNKIIYRINIQKAVYIAGKPSWIVLAREKVYTFFVNRPSSAGCTRRLKCKKDVRPGEFD